MGAGWLLLGSPGHDQPACSGPGLNGGGGVLPRRPASVQLCSASACGAWPLSLCAGRGFASAGVSEVVRAPAAARAGAAVFGISSDSPAENKAFAESQRLPYPLLTDASSILRKK